MAYEFKLPDIGEGVVEGEVVKWLVNEGDAVAEDQPMVEVILDKAGQKGTGRWTSEIALRHGVPPGEVEVEREVSCLGLLQPPVEA